MSFASPLTLSVCRISALSAHPLMNVAPHRMIVDYKLFISGSTIKPDTLWITEQMPGAMYSKDVSQILNDQGYWSRSARSQPTHLSCPFSHTSLELFELTVCLSLSMPAVLAASTVLGSPLCTMRLVTIG
jgi:hypothetical protein